MADLQQVFAEGIKLNRRITQFLKFSTYTDYGDLGGLDDFDRTDGEQLLHCDGSKFKVTMKQHLTYTAELSDDPVGNVTRINNALV